MITSIELRLEGGASPSGEITAKDLVGIVGALQDLVNRLMRQAADAADTGRAKKYVEEASQVRLGGVQKGSTVLAFAKGSTETLDVELPGLAQADDRLWEVFGAIGENRRPGWAAAGTVQVIGRLAGALKGAAQRTTVSADGRPSVSLESDAFFVETWVSAVSSGARGTATGRLEKVDLKSRAFRLRDDVNWTVDLRRVVDAEAAAQMVGQWVTAEGDATLGDLGRVIALSDAFVSPVDDPAADLLATPVMSLNDILASAPGPGAGGGIDLTDDEFDDFLRAARS